MRKVAKKLRDEAEKMEELKISVRREDVALKPFAIPLQNVDMQHLQSREMVTINRVVRPGVETFNHSLKV
jgi:CHAD domain-containing protein